MIAHLRGKLLAKHPNQAIVEIGGVGYDVIISVPTFSDLPAAGAEVALRDKLPAPSPSSVPAAPAMSATEEDVLSALLNLGYQRAAAEKALTVVAKNGKGVGFDSMFRETLAALTK